MKMMMIEAGKAIPYLPPPTPAFPLLDMLSADWLIVWVVAANLLAIPVIFFLPLD